MSEHISRKEADQLLQGSLQRKKRSKIVRHLLTGCLDCAVCLREVTLSKGSIADYSDVMRRCGLSYVVAQGQVQTEKIHAAKHWPSLMKQPSEVRLLMVRDIASYQTWGIFDLVMEEVKKISANDPLQAVDLAHLAVSIAQLLPIEWYGEERISDYMASAYTALGNAKRLASDFEGAKEALAESEEFLRNGTGDPYERANLISIRSSLTSDLGYLEDSTEMLFSAIRLARRVRDEQLEGKLILQQSSTIGFVDPALALELAKKGAELVGFSNTHLELIGRYLLAYWTNELGDSREASRLIEEYRHVFTKYDGMFWRGRLLNLQGRISRAEGRLVVSEQCYRRLVTLFEEAEFEFDLVLANLDLADALAEQGKIDESAQILQTLYPVLQKWHLNADILRSWMILLEGVKQHTVQDHAFKELALMLRRKWYRKN